MKSELPATLQNSIHYLRSQGVSQREIARRLRISRRQVSGVVNLQKNVAENGGSAQFTRCPECGGRVKMPCLRCGLGEKRSTMIIHMAGSPSPLSLELRKREYKRYLEVKKE